MVIKEYMKKQKRSMRAKQKAKEYNLKRAEKKNSNAKVRMLKKMIPSKEVNLQPDTATLPAESGQTSTKN